MILLLGHFEHFEDCTPTFLSENEGDHAEISPGPPSEQAFDSKKHSPPRDARVAGWGGWVVVAGWLVGWLAGGWWLAGWLGKGHWFRHTYITNISEYFLSHFCHIVVTCL